MGRSASHVSCVRTLAFSRELRGASQKRILPRWLVSLALTSTQSLHSPAIPGQPHRKKPKLRGLVAVLTPQRPIRSKFPPLNKPLLHRPRKRRFLKPLPGTDSPRKRVHGCWVLSASATRRSRPASAQQHSGSSSGRAPARRRQALSSAETQWTHGEALLGLSLRSPHQTACPCPEVFV